MKKWIAYLVFLACVSVWYVRAQERLVLSTPIPATSSFRPFAVSWRRAHPDLPASISVTLRETDASGQFVSMGRSLDCLYEGDIAETVITAMLRAAPKISIDRYMIQRCQMDGKLSAGTIAGTP